MPGASGIAVAEQITHRPYIIFTTAFDRYAVTAFEIGALDYLLKPFGRERVHAVLARARTGDGARHAGHRRARQNVLSATKPLSHVFVKERGRMLAVPLERVERLEACDDYVALVRRGPPPSAARAAAGPGRAPRTLALRSRTSLARGEPLRS